jgi:hypothetical protein
LVLALTGHRRSRLSVAVLALAMLLAIAGCGNNASIASAAEIAPTLAAHHGIAAFQPAPGFLSNGQTTGDVRLTSVLPDHPAMFTVQVAAKTACAGSVAFSNTSGSERLGLDPISTSTEGELSWRWDTPTDVSSDGGIISMTCGADAFRVFFGIGAPEIGLLPAR